MKYLNLDTGQLLETIPKLIRTNGKTIHNPKVKHLVQNGYEVVIDFGDNTV